MRRGHCSSLKVARAPGHGKLLTVAGVMTGRLLVHAFLGFGASDILAKARRYHLTPRSQQMLNGPPSADRLSFQLVWS